MIFNIAHIHEDILQDERRKNILECIIYLYETNLLPFVLVKIDHCLDPTMVGFIILTLNNT